MTPRTALLPILLMSFPMSSFSTPLSGIESDVEIVRVENIPLEALGYAELTSGASDKTERLVRVVAHAGNGRYLVAVRSNIGITRMKGAYLDSALTVEDGSFNFYYPNGRLESAGLYAGGTKSGTWMRYALDGTQLAERNYTGLTTEELLTAVGVVEKANVGEATKRKAVAGSATRRSGTPVEF